MEKAITQSRGKGHTGVTDALNDIMEVLRKMYLLSIVESPMINSDLVFIICNASSTSEWLGSSLDAFNAVWHGAAGDGKALHAL